VVILLGTPKPIVGEMNRNNTVVCEDRNNLKCPFCSNHCIPPKSGKACCPVCKVQFEIDDRLECVFVDTDKIRLPAKGIVCPMCGLIQNDDVKTGLYCGMGINLNVQ
jgi:hypothetical protein